MDMTDRKMNPKAPKTGGIDLDALTNFANKANDTEEDAPEAPVIASKQKKGSDPTQESQETLKAAQQPSQRVRKPKKQKEHRTANINIRLTPAEAQKLQEKAGLVNVSVYVRKVLSDQGVI